MQAKTTGLFAKGGMGIPFSAVPRDGPTGYQAVLSAAATGQLRVPSSRKIYVGNLPTDCAEVFISYHMYLTFLTCCFV